ncbi:uncharacterized protein N0V89_003984 [Didymosphaeria variabile]|uniref:Large ribosomal subunit protein bL28m n=1 Tax=Didymosphaeria variabile TaxID=1932322 RepID=A0A9W9CC09_9PLEO|nr:uncharacterized protein N0V89_003984 [Didymosphaeria variabile]KAJ4355959.1 hypothetical protein N0V89_003984 [Didymosphaeria variabile]
MPPRCLPLSGNLAKPSTLARSSQSLARTFTSTAAVLANPLERRRGGDLGSHLPKYIIPQNVKIPEYPYGTSELFKQQDKGLYGGKMIHFGNNVSKKTETKTRRYWKPNVLNKALYSVALKKKIKLRVTSNVIKQIDREGGLDEYLLKQSDSRVKELGPLGWALRWTLLQRPSVVRRMRSEAAALGVPQDEIDAQWPEPPSVDMTPEELESFDDAALDALEYLEGGKMAQAEEAKADKELRRTKHQISVDAARSFREITFAAHRYVKCGMVDTMEQGIKLAYLREDQRAESRQRNFGRLKATVEDKYGRTFEDDWALKQAIEKYRKEVRKEVAEKFGGDHKEYRDQKSPDGAAKIAAAVAEAGTEEALKAQQRALALKELSDSERALSDENTTEDERVRIESALQRAQQTIDAETKAAYIEQSLARWEQGHEDKWPLNSVSREEGLGEAWEEAAQFEQGGLAQGWDALADPEPVREKPRV